MYHYRLYQIDRLCNIVRPAIMLHLHTDSDAFAEALQMVTPSHGVEIWRNRRLVFKLPPQPEQRVARGSPDPNKRAMYRPD